MTQTAGTGCRSWTSTLATKNPPSRSRSASSFPRSRALSGAKWRASENNRRAKYYELTTAGRRRLDASTQEWRRLIAAVELVLAG